MARRGGRGEVEEKTVGEGKMRRPDKGGRRQRKGKGGRKEAGEENHRKDGGGGGGGGAHFDSHIIAARGQVPARYIHVQVFTSACH